MVPLSKIRVWKRKRKREKARSSSITISIFVFFSFLMSTGSEKERRVDSGVWNLDSENPHDVAIFGAYILLEKTRVESVRYGYGMKAGSSASASADRGPKKPGVAPEEREAMSQFAFAAAMKRVCKLQKLKK